MTPRLAGYELRGGYCDSGAPEVGGNQAFGAGGLLGVQRTELE